MNILAIGDVVGTAATDVLIDKLQGVKKLYNIDFVVVNGENAAGHGIATDQAQAILDAGADVITLGNHTLDQHGIVSFLNDCRYILRPANFGLHMPGHGWGVFETSFGNVYVINLIGRLYTSNDLNPFIEADSIIKQLEQAKVILVDFHAETTFEKLALAYYLDGRVSALWGTHTHVQTSDYKVLPGGTGYITDLGMTGPENSVIGGKPDQIISSFLDNPSEEYEIAEGPIRIEGAVFEVNTDTGLCLGVEAIRV